jgi:hypothetical protein
MNGANAMVTLSSEDFNRLVEIISRVPDFAAEQSRIAWVHNLLRDSPRAPALRGSLSLGASDSRLDAITLVQYLTRFGQDVPGREVIALLIDGLLQQTAAADDADFLRGLLQRYPLKP